MPESTPLIGRFLSRYRILEEVGRGGMATVFRALDPALGREVAVKVLHPHLAGQPEARSRLQREAQAVAKLHHDNILEIHDYSGADSTESFIVTEFIRGPTLTAFLAQTRVGVPEAAEMIVHELAAALETAHKAGIIHRDIKPENVMIRTADGRIKLTDFGIAQVIDKERLTATGQLIGSPAYLAPELVEGGQVDFRTDVFSLGVVLYRVATGQLPFAGRNPHEMMKRIVEGRFPPPDQVNAAVGRGLQRIIARTLARRPDDRYADMEALRRDLAADLAVAGIEDVRAELGRYLADPAAWEVEARPRITAALLQSARRELARRKAASALSLVGRALSLSPGDMAAKALFERLGRRRRRGSIALAAAVAALVVGGSTAAMRYRASHPRPIGRPSTVSAALPRPVVMATRPAPAPAPGPLLPVAATLPEVRPRPLHTRAGAGSRERDVEIRVFPQNVRVLVDNRPIPGEYWRPGEPIHVGPGPHTLTFENDACRTEWRRIGESTVAIPDLIRLAWKDGSLRIDTVPSAADVDVMLPNGISQPFRGGVPIPIRIPAEFTEPRVRVTYAVSAPGYVSSPRREVFVQAGDRPTVKSEVLTPR